MSGRKYCKEQRERFLDLIDRGGTVRAAASAANPECQSNRGRTPIAKGPKCFPSIPRVAWF